jgi:hypothetical protein
VLSKCRDKTSARRATADALFLRWQIAHREVDFDAAK